MKTLLTISTLVFTLMFSSTSFADWTKVGETVDGDTLYVDFERIRKHDGLVYFWELLDYLKPDEYRTFSYTIYKQGDCKLFRFKELGGELYTKPMGKERNLNDQMVWWKDWQYPPPNSPDEIVLKSVCSR